MKKSPIAIIATAAVLTMSSPLVAKPALKDVAYVRDGIITVGIAYEISQKCDTISARLLRGFAYLNGLKGHARSLGYTDAEIESYIDDDAEKARLESVARTRLTQMGAVSGDAQSYCALGQAEIAQGSAVGQLLR